MLVTTGCGIGPTRPATRALQVDDTFADPGPDPPSADLNHDAPDDPNRAIVAQAQGPTVGVYHGPTDPTPYVQLANPNRDGAPLVFLVKERDINWLKVLLPVRPNGTTGWIKADQVNLASDYYKVVVELDAHRISVYDKGDVIQAEAIGVGRAETPTPGGEYY